MKGHTIGGLVIVVLLLGKVDFQNVFLQSSWWIRLQCYMEMLLSRSKED